MKTSRLFITITGIACFIVLTSETTGILDSSGKFGNAGGPGEQTCSSTGCHGSGNGSGSSGGLANNAGPGSITLTSVPAFVGNTYVPNQVYTITINVAETGKNKFGFSCEFLDNSGNTNPSVNNSVGLVTITNSVTTRKGQPFGTARMYITHQTNGGAIANSANFIFNWTAPASGTINAYYDGTAVNNDALANALDNVYAHNFQLVPAGPLGIEVISKMQNLKIISNPTKDILKYSFNVSEEIDIESKLVDLSGKKVVESKTQNYKGNIIESIDISTVQSGLYFLILKGQGFVKTEKIIIIN